MQQVRTNYGIVEGEILESGVSVFKGIPYAAPPVGNLRWKRPIPPHKWEGIRPAKEFSPIYPQSDDYPFYVKEFGRPSDYPTSEDCLYLNIWTNAKSTTDKFPVLFFIHGGGYDHGYGHRTPINGENFAQKDIVFVSFNYRIGVFGFLSHPLLECDEHEIYELKEDDELNDDLEPKYIITEPSENFECSENSEYSENSEDEDSNANANSYYHSDDGSIEKSGNYGLYDQLAALHWVHENISHFGGDPSNIILIGQSAGAMSIEIMYESKLTRGLFSKVIMMSGGGYITKIPILKSLGCRSRKEVQRTSGRLLLHTLKCKTLSEARKIPYKVLYEAYEKCVYPFTLTPFVDGEIYTQSHAKWEKHLRTLHHQEKDILTNKHKHVPSSVDLSDLHYYRNIPMIIGCLQNEFGYQTKTYFYRCTINLCNFLCETVFNNPEFKNKGPFLYFGKYSMPGEDKRGAFHSSEMWFVFEQIKNCWRKMGEKEEQLSHLFSNYWSNFAHTGNPNGLELPDWHPFTSEKPKQLTIEDKKVTMKKKHKF